MTLVSYALVTLADTKTFLGINNNTKDDLLTLLINMATDYFEKHTNRRFVSTAYVEKYDGTGRRELQLNQYPVITFTSLEENQATDNSDDWVTIDSSEYFVETDTGLITKTSAFLDFNDDVPEGLSNASVFTLGKQKYRATYTAGYADVPYDIQYAVMMFVGEALNKRANAGVKQESLGDHSVTFMSALETSPELKQVIANYREITL